MSRGSFFGQKAKDIQRCMRNIHSFTDGQAVVLDWDADNLQSITIQLRPNDGIFQGGRFDFLIKFADRYPEVAPKLNCLTNIYHPNINMEYKTDAEGNVCLSLFDDWSQARHGLEDVINSLLFLLNYPNLRDPWPTFISPSMSRRTFKKKVRQSLAGMRLDGVEMAFTKFVEYDKSLDKYDSDYESDYGSDADSEDDMAKVDMEFFMNGNLGRREEKMEVEEEMEGKGGEKKDEEAEGAKEQSREKELTNGAEENGERKEGEDGKRTENDQEMTDRTEREDGGEKSENADKKSLKEEEKIEIDDEKNWKIENVEEKNEKNENLAEKSENSQEKSENAEEKSENLEERSENADEKNGISAEKIGNIEHSNDNAEKKFENNENTEEKVENAEKKIENGEEKIEIIENAEEKNENTEDKIENAGKEGEEAMDESQEPKEPLDISELLNKVEAIVTSLKSEDFVDEAGNSPDLFSEDVSCSGTSDPVESNEEQGQSNEEKTQSNEEQTQSKEESVEATTSGAVTLSRQDTKVLPDDKTAARSSRGNIKRCMSVDALMKQFPRRALTSFVALSRQETKCVLKLSKTMKRLHSQRTDCGEPSSKKPRLSGSTANCTNDGASDAEPVKYWAIFDHKIDNPT